MAILLQSSADGAAAKGETLSNFHLDSISITGVQCMATIRPKKILDFSVTRTSLASLILIRADVL